MARSSGNPDKKSGSKLPPQEWDFDSVPKKELIACVIWEYLRECQPHLLGQRAHHLVLQLSYDTWDERKRLNARYQNVPKTVIASALGERRGELPPWQTLPEAEKESFAASKPKRPALIPLKASRDGLWEWSYTFQSEETALEFPDWFKASGDLLSALNRDARGELEAKSQDMLRSFLHLDANFDFGTDGGDKNEPPDPTEASDIISAMQPGMPGISMDLVAGRLFGFLRQPAFLINWQEYDKAEIAAEFSKWLERTKPAALKPRVLNSESKAISLHRDLKGLGIMRLLHIHAAAELVELYTPRFNRYRDAKNHKQLYRLRSRALEKFRAYVALKADETPKSVMTQGGRSGVGQ